MKLPFQFCLFGLSGAVGLVVDIAILYLLKGPLGLYGARVISFTSAAFTTWLLNRILAFRYQTSGQKASREFVQYFLLMLIGGVANYGTYAFLVTHFIFFSSNLAISVAPGSLIGLLINYLTSRFLLFRFAKKEV